jgi:hypothetical protein
MASTSYVVILIILFALGIAYLNKHRFRISKPFNPAYLETLKKHKEEGHFPYRYLCDENQQILPIVLVSAFFRNDLERQMYHEYRENGVQIVGITAYKTFPKPIDDGTGDSETVKDPFNYTAEIRDWLCCFKDPASYGLTSWNRLYEISESDFYDADDSPAPTKLYDFIYICLKDDDTCPEDGWNAVNRNFKLAQACLPIMINEMGYRVLVIGRINCGLEQLYGERITVMDFLPYAEFQKRIWEARYLFVPNVYDASPRVVTESLIKDVGVLMNQGIVCGSKYIVDQTGELFTDEHDIRSAIDALERRSANGTLQPREWWKAHFSRKKSGGLLRNTLQEWFGGLDTVTEVYFL